MSNKPGSNAGAGRTLSTYDLLFIWFGAAIAITEIWAGGNPSLKGLGLGLGLVAIVVGRIVGNGLMAAMARIGAKTELPTMLLTRPAFGVRGSYLLAAVNILQLLGWTGWMLFVGFTYLDVLSFYINIPVGNPDTFKAACILILGVLCIIWAAGGRRFWQAVQRTSAALLLLLTVIMTVVIFREYDVASLWATGPSSAKALNLLSGADLVIAMSVSWLPLVADYSRFAKNTAAGTGGTFWGYFIGGTWMYAVGLLVALATGAESPDTMVMTVMGSQGILWAFMAIFLVLLSTVTTTFLDIYSAVVSTQSLVPKLPSKAGSIAFGLVGMAVAVFLKVEHYEPFLLAISAIFLPAFTIVLVDHYWVAGRKVSVSQVAAPGGKYWFTGGFNWRAIAAWAVGFVAFDWAGGFGSLGYFSGALGKPEVLAGFTPWATGSSLPCIVISATAYLVMVLIFGNGIPKRVYQ